MIGGMTIAPSWPSFGQQFANQLRRRRAQTGDKWHLDEVFLTIKGKRPASELRDPEEWARLWYEARHTLATESMGRFNRWSADSPMCA